MNLIRLYTGTDGESHFEELGEIQLKDAASVDSKLSPKFETKGMLIHQYGENFDETWHNPSLGRIYVIFLEGNQQITASDGEKRVFHYGDILLIEDTVGRGHCTQAVGGKGGKSIILTLDK